MSRNSAIHAPSFTLGLRTRVRDLEAENETLRRRLAGTASPVIRSDGHSPGDGAAGLSPETMTRKTSAPGGDRGEQNLHMHPALHTSQPLHQLGQTTFVIEAPENQQSPPKGSKMDRLVAAAPKTEMGWLNKRKQLSLSDHRSVIRTFLQFISCVELPITFSANITGESSEMDTLLRTYQQFVQSLHRGRERITYIISE